MTDSLKEKVVLVTGAAGGIGTATCRLLARRGARVVVTDRLESDAISLAAEFTETGFDALGIALDVTREEHWEAAMAATVERHGRLDGLVNNAGVYLFRAIEDMTLDEWQGLHAVNNDGIFLGTKHAARTMRRTLPDGAVGCIVNVSSVAGLVGAAFQSAYNASKGAVTLFSKSAALEFAARKEPIRVNVVHPAVVDDAMGEALLEAQVAAGRLPADKAKEAMVALRHPIGRLADPQDVAKAIAFLLSEDSAYMTGSSLVVDGGLTAQ